MKYLDRVITEMKAKNNPLYETGWEWYAAAAMRSINQAIGRVIRHKYDFGGVVLLDSRYTWSKQKNGISSWMRQEIFECEHDGQCKNIFESFYQKAYEYCQA